MKVTVTVKPAAKQTRIEKISDNNFLVWVKEPPREGRATSAAIKVLADYLGIAKSRVILLKGNSSRNKLFEVI